MYGVIGWLHCIKCVSRLAAFPLNEPFRSVDPPNTTFTTPSLSSQWFPSPLLPFSRSTTSRNLERHLPAFLFPSLLLFQTCK